MKPASEGKSDLSRRTVYGYGLGEFGYSFYLNLISSYLMFYMTDVLLLPTKLTGILYSAVQWVEAATALAAGILIDNLFTSKGRYRPWIFRGSVICALSTALLFTRLPLGAAGTATVFVVLYTISYAGYNLMFVAYRAIMGAIGKTPSDTVALTISGTQLSTLASLAFGQIGVRLLHGFSRIETGLCRSVRIDSGHRDGRGLRGDEALRSGSGGSEESGKGARRQSEADAPRSAAHSALCLWLYIQHRGKHSALFHACLLF